MKELKLTELIPDTAWVAENLITEEECEYFMKRAKEAGIGELQSAGDIRHRDSRTVALEDVDMAVRVFERIKAHLPPDVCVDDEHENLGLSYNKKELFGKWTPYGLNSRWRVVCYPGSGHFGPHRDACHIEDEHHRSLITINGYLTDRPLGYGGATRFLKDDLDVSLNSDGKFVAPEDSVLHRVEANKAGKAVLFFHDLMHDGEQLKEGSPPKWMFRTDVLYQRDVSTAPELTKYQRQARELLKQAEALETAGSISGAIRIYKNAYKL
eukprot:CAMPEP_0113557432 /NCGR_PEP_ID=MMETSP0015_2-20120614/17790_1 /TAXON_ID=2838 /ORGANISM="Odontella" /LENGTH=267 /DNA_ID=CAMNT_0000458861 /DNA_START=115 /DNA_END=915 /DNA_ORIENTATION=+ /assembly_acc=CAM_ASM_000160